MSTTLVLTLFSLLVSAELSSVEDEKRIYGGRFALQGEFPWMVFIKLTDELNCSGFLISSSYVLTAAHCMIQPVDTLLARIGSVDKDSGQEYQFQSAVVHPGYENFTYYADIAVLKLASPVSFSSDIDRICLPSDDRLYQPSTSVLQMGWGRFSNTSSQVTQILKITEAGSIWSRNECQNLFDQYNSRLNNGTVCIKNTGDDGVCEGDSGGPLVVKQGTTYTVIGLDSIGFYANCTVDNSLTELFTNVFHYRQWIIDQMDETICEN